MTSIPYPHLMPPLRRQWQAEGRLEGRLEDVLRVLQTRGLAVSKEVESRIRDCADLDQAEALLTRAVTVAHAEDIFPA